jgi:hypothetical protein
MKQKKITCTAIGMITVIFVLFAALALAAPPDNFTAKMTAMGIAMPMAKMGNKSRMENIMMGGLVTISLLDQKKTVMMNVKNKTYFEKAMEDKVASIHDPRAVIDKKKIGSETIDGHPCLKYDTVFYLKERPQEKFNAVIWEAQDLGGLPIRTEMAVPESSKMGGPGKIVTEFKDIKIGAATASMFEIPKDYKKVNSMNEVMGMGQPGDMKGMQEMMKQMQKMKPPKE